MWISEILVKIKIEVKPQRADTLSLICDQMTSSIRRQLSSDSLDSEAFCMLEDQHVRLRSGISDVTKHWQGEMSKVLMYHAFQKAAQ